jgi:uncharacterized surface protein with fasciclin (FAS1) repeats
MFSMILPLLALALLPFSNAQSDGSFLSGLISALQSSNLTSLANVTTRINSTSGGQKLLSSLANGTYTVFAPNDQALSNVPQNVTSNPDLLTSVISYHIVRGNFTGVSSAYPNVTIGRSLLNESSLVMLEGNKSQVVVWSTREDQQVHVLNQPSDTRIVGSATFQNITVFVVDNVLTIPANLQTTIANNSNLSNLGQLAQSLVVPGLNTSSGSTPAANMTLIDVLSRARGVTIFAPNNDAFSNAASQLGSLQSNSTALFDILRNRVINGTTVYSSGLSSNPITTAAGEPVSFTANSTGTFVTSGNVTARIVQPDVLISNGVVHIIDRILLNTEVNEAAASSAYESATSVAAVPTTETGAVGASPSASGNPNNGTPSGAVFLRPMDISAAVFSFFVGSLFVLL